MFRLTNVVDSYCGLHCSMCVHNTEKECSGCIESGGGLSEREQCPIAACCIEKGLEHCGQCDAVPCAMLAQLASSDVPQNARVEQCKRWSRVEKKQVALIK